VSRREDSYRAGLGACYSHDDFEVFKWSRREVMRRGACYHCAPDPQAVFISLLSSPGAVNSTERGLNRNSRRVLGWMHSDALAPSVLRRHLEREVLRAVAQRAAYQVGRHAAPLGGARAVRRGGTRGGVSPLRRGRPAGHGVVVRRTTTTTTTTTAAAAAAAAAAFVPVEAARRLPPRRLRLRLRSAQHLRPAPPPPAAHVSRVGVRQPR
jgi:hypothetical protein